MTKLRTLRTFSHALLMRVAAAGLAITAAASTLLTGCAHAVPGAYTVPSVAPVAAALSTTRGEIGNTRAALAKASARAARLAIPAQDRAQLQQEIAMADAYAQRADSSAALTLTNLGTFNAAVTNQTAVLNLTTERLNYIEPKYQKAVGLIWKWRLYFLGLAGGLIAYLLIKYSSRLAVTAAASAAKIP